jgi:hypothetical protein
MKKTVFTLGLLSLTLAACAQAPAPYAPPVAVQPAPGSPQAPIVVQPSNVVVGQPQVVVQPAPVVMAPPPGVVYVAPTYPAPAVGFVWAYHPRFGWGWRHPEHGWHRGWR